MRSMGPGEILFELIKIAVGPEDGPARLVVWLIQTIRISNSRQRVIRRGKKRSAADVTERSI